jgi:DtxR family Mn-dependent transcriptional regulator
MAQSSTEQNYLKAIYHLAKGQPEPVNTSSIAAYLNTTSASVTDMLKRLAEKNLISYEKYKGVKLSRKGEKVALDIIRKHRLWEVFLTRILKFRWDEVHEMAEELEHVSSNELIERLSAFLGDPSSDPHGDPIPDAKGHISDVPGTALTESITGSKYLLSGVTDHRPDFLQFLASHSLIPGTVIKVIQIRSVDQSLELQIRGKEKVFISNEMARNLLIKSL